MARSGEVRCVKLRLGLLRQGKAGEAGSVWLGSAMSGKVRLGGVCPCKVCYGRLGKQRGG